MSVLREGKVFVRSVFAGVIQETDEGYLFQYDEAYLSRKDACSVSLTLPLRSAVYRSHTLFPFFDGLIPEGWLLNLACRNWKIDSNDRFGLLLTACRDCIGCVTIQGVEA